MNNKDSSKLDTSKIDIIVKSLNLLYTIGESEKIENNELFETITNKINDIETKIEELDNTPSSSPSSSSSKKEEEKKEEGGEEEKKKKLEEEAKKKREEEAKKKKLEEEEKKEEGGEEAKKKKLEEEAKKKREEEAKKKKLEEEAKKKREEEEAKKKREEEERLKKEKEKKEKEKKEEERKKREAEEAEKKKREEKAKKESDYIYSNFLQKIYKDEIFKNIDKLKNFNPTDYLSKNTNNRGIGIQNYGNTCYQASLLQVLFFLDIYRNNIIKYGSNVEEILIKNNIILSYEEEKKSNPNYDYKKMNDHIMGNTALKIELYKIVDTNFDIEKKSDFNPILLLILYRYMLLLAYYWVDIDNNISNTSIFSFPAYLTYYNIFHTSCNDIPDIIPSTKKQLDANEFLAELLIRCLNIFCNEGKNLSGNKVTMSNISENFCNIQFSAKRIFHFNQEVINDFKEEFNNNLKDGIKKIENCLIHERKMQKSYQLEINNLNNSVSLQNSINNLNKNTDFKDLYPEQHLLNENYKKKIIANMKDSNKLKYFYIPFKKIESKNTKIINIVNNPIDKIKKIEINIKQGNSKKEIEGTFRNGNNTFFIFNKEEESITRISKTKSLGNDKFKKKKFENISNIDTILENITINGIYLAINKYEEKEELVETTNMDFINIYLKRTDTSLEKKVELPENNILNINNKKYKIKAVIFKPGKVNSGHYYTKILINDTWYIADDSSFHIISDKKLTDLELETYTNVFVEKIEKK